MRSTASAPRLRMCAAGCTASMPTAASSSAPIARSPFGAPRRATAGSLGSLACRAFIKSPVSAMTGSPICSTPGIAGKDTGRVMRMLTIAIAMLAAAGTAKAAEIDAFISTALKTVTDEVIPPFERAGGHTVRALYAPPGALLKHFAAGEPADIFLTGREAIDLLIGEGKIVSGRIDLATTGIGICVRKGAPKPDISTPDAFKRAMLAAKTVGYASPAGGSIAGPMAPKSRLSAGGPNGRVSVLVASGEAEIGLQQVSELLSNPDVEVIGM